jgi:hypothetical protein
MNGKRPSVIPPVEEYERPIEALEELEERSAPNMESRQVELSHSGRTLGLKISEEACAAQRC